MSRLLKYGSMVILSALQVFLAPFAAENTVLASIRELDKADPTVISVESEKIRNGLFEMAVGKCFPDTVCPAPDKPAPLIHRDKTPAAAHTGAGDSMATGSNKYDSGVGSAAGRDRNVKGKALLTTARFQALTHLVSSHLSIVTRPVTAGKRLFFLAYDTLKDTVGWPAISAKAAAEARNSPGSGAMDLEAWERRLDEMTGSEASYGTLDFLVDGEEFFPRFFETVGSARQTVKIRTYIFDNDDFALKIAETLKERSKKVDVKVLMDGLGTIFATGVEPETLPAGYKPPRSVREFLTKGSNVRVRQQFNPWFTGDHSKTVIVDDERAFVGGMNFGREYRYEWHDMMIEASGPVVGEISREFGKAWAGGGVLGDIESFFYSLERHRKRESKKGYPVRLLYTKPGSSEIRNAQLEAIRRSRSYIYIQNPYLTDDRILNELVKASNRGVDVKIVFPNTTDNGAINRSNVLAANRMFENGIKVFILPRMTHVKAAVYDGWACFGSANFDKLSFRVNYEINLATSHKKTVEKLIKCLFIPDFEASVELTEKLPVKANDFLLELVADQL